MSQILGAASTRWADYQGTAAADDAEAVVHSRSIYELAGLDRDAWTIVAVDLFMHNNPQVALYATAQGSIAQGSTAPDAEAAVPVTRFRITDQAKVEAFLEQAFKTVAVRLVTSRLAGQDLEVTETVALD